MLKYAGLTMKRGRRLWLVSLLLVEGMGVDDITEVAARGRESLTGTKEVYIAELTWRIGHRLSLSTRTIPARLVWLAARLPHPGRCSDV